MSRITSAQAVKIREWLEGDGFHASETPENSSSVVLQHWSREDCSVRLTAQRSYFKVDIRHGGDHAAWVGLDELVNLRSAWPEAATISPIKLATFPQFHLHSHLRGIRRSPGGWLYQVLRPGAHGVKVLLQMLVGIGATLAIGMQVNDFVNSNTNLIPPLSSTMVVIRVIAYALAVAAAIELAYTLFTPGPDEALDPLTLGLSSGLLLLITTDTGKELTVIMKFSGILLGVLALGILFLIRRHLLSEEEE